MLRLLLAVFFTSGMLSSSFVFAQDQNILPVHSVQVVPDSLQPAAAATNSVKAPRISLLHSLKSQAVTPIRSKPLSVRSVVVPSAMIAYGAFTLASKDLQKVNRTVRKEVWEDRNNGMGKSLHLDDYSMYAPAVAVYALNMAGIKGKHNFVDRSALYGLSMLIGNNITSYVKRAAQVTRPDSSSHSSFTSGHTSTAFIAAEFLRQEYKDVSPWIGVAGYAVAAGTGFLRIYNNKHWLNDVIAGAGVGLISTRLSYWLYPKLKNTFLHGRKGNTVMLPAYQNGTFGVAMVSTF